MKNNEYFCFLENDIKTFEYTKRYIKTLLKISLNKEDIFNLDNEIQSEEIQLHLNRLQIPEWDINKILLEKIKWTEINSKPFRIYLNSIKMIALISITFHNCCNNCEITQEYTQEKYNKIVRNINEFKLNLIDTIFLS